MNSNFDKIIKINKKDIESDDEDFEDEEEEVEVEVEEEIITSEEAETEEEEELTVLYEEYDIDKIAYLFKNIELFSDKIYNKCKNDNELKKEINKLKNWSFCIKQSVLCFPLVCCVLCELCDTQYVCSVCGIIHRAGDWLLRF